MTKKKAKVKTRPILPLKQNRPVEVRLENDSVIVKLQDGQVVSNPLKWHPWLQNSTEEQRAEVEFWHYSVWWPLLDEGLDVEGMIRGIPSDKSFLNKKDE